MNNTEIEKYFKDDIESLAGLFESRNIESRNYLESRRAYKLETFEGMTYNNLILSLNQDFNNLVNRFQKDDLEDFIRITCVQDIMVFDRVMLDLIGQSDEHDPVSLNSFIRGRKIEYETLFKERIANLPTVARHHLTASRSQFKTGLYLRSRSVDIEFYSNHNRELNLIHNLNEDFAEKFIEAMMLQDLALICEYHEQNARDNIKPSDHHP